MHSADLIDRNIFIFRGGNCKDCLNDIHVLNVDSNSWSYIDA
jgi:hypothetical protein